MIVNAANKCRCCLTLKTVKRIELTAPGIESGLAFESEQMIVTDVDAWSAPVLDAKVTFSDNSTKKFYSVSTCMLIDDTQQAFLTLFPGDISLTDDDIAESDRGVWSFVGLSSFEGVKSEKDVIPAWFFYEEGYFYPPVFGDGLWRRS